MDVNAISSTNIYPTNTTIPATSSNEKENKANETQKATNGVVYEKNNKSVKDRYKPDPVEINRLIQEGKDQVEAMKKLLMQIVEKQGNKFKKTVDELTPEDIRNMVKDPEVIAQAQKDIAEDGYWGVEKTSDRIVDFAKALSGGDPSKIGLLKDAVVQGFKEAGVRWGEEMPQITKDTYEAVMRKFDEWENGTASTEKTS